MHKHPVDFAFETSSNPTMQEILATIKRIAASHVNVLITGEGGTGKEWMATIIHKSSPRIAGPLVTVECASIPSEQLERELFGYESITWKGVDIKPGGFEEAREGTLLMNEIGQVPPPMLMRVARAAEYQWVRRIGSEVQVDINTRVIATMTVHNHAPSWKGTIGEEVLHRLSPIHIELPPLRRRREDIPFLVNGFLGEIRERAGSGPERLSQDALDVCIRFDWPGNIRHLRNAIEYASVMCGEDTIMPAHLPTYLHETGRKG
jgi:DNA-binding NtrC family response regulator